MPRLSMSVQSSSHPIPSRASAATRRRNGFACWLSGDAVALPSAVPPESAEKNSMLLADAMAGLAMFIISVAAEALGRVNGEGLAIAGTSDDPERPAGRAGMSATDAAAAWVDGTSAHGSKPRTP